MIRAPATRCSRVAGAAPTGRGRAAAAARRGRAAGHDRGGRRRASSASEPGSSQRGQSIPSALEAGAGLGAHVGVKVTDAVGLVVGYNEQDVYAVHGRYIGTAVRQSRGILVLAQSRVLSDGAEMTPLLGDRPYTYDGPNPPYHVYSDPMSKMLPIPLMGATPRDVLVDQKERWLFRPHRTLDLHAELSLGVGLHVGVSPGEFVDFLLGWFGIDIVGDEVG